MFSDINLRDINHYHHEFKTNNAFHENYVGYGVKIENMKQVFMVRSPYVMNNMTDLEYFMRILREDGKTLIKTVEMKPNSCFPIAYEDMNLRFSLSSLRSPNQWSNSIKFKTIIEKVPKNKTVSIKLIL